MTIYYCNSNAGSDGSGTIGSPFNNANNHVGDLVPGDTMYLRGSVNSATPQEYSGQILITTGNGCESGTSGNRITIANYPGEYVVIKASSGIHGISIVGINYWTISGTNTNYGIEIDQNGYGQACINNDQSNFTTIEYVETHNCSYDSIVRVRASDDVTIQYCYIYDNDILAGTDHSGIMAYPINSPTSGADSYRLTVRYCTITGCAGDCVVIERQPGVDNYFRDCVIEYNDFSPHSTAAASEQGTDCKSAYGAILRYNTYHGFRYNDGSVGSTGAGSGSGCAAVGLISENITFYGNVFYDYSCSGIFANRTNVDIYKNYFYGAVFESSPVPSYLHNHIYLTHSSGTSTVNVIKNTFVGRHTSSGNCITIDVAGTITVNYRDNCHSATGGLSNTGATLNYSYNGWFASPAATWAGTGDVTGSDAGFVNAGANNYHITTSSACKDAGLAVSPYTDGYYGAAPDIGADEFIGTSDSPSQSPSSSPSRSVSPSASASASASPSTGIALPLPNYSNIVFLSGAGARGREPEYQMELLAADGARIAYLSDVGPFSYTKALNSEGDFSVTLSPEFDNRWIQKDRRIVISRRPPGGVLSVDFSGIIRDWDIEQTSGGYKYTVAGPGPGWLLSGRRVAYYSGHASASMTDEAGDMILEIVRDNLGADATTGNGRKASGVITSTLFTVQAAGTYGPSVQFKFAYNHVLDTVNKIAEAARQAGTPVYWTMAPSGNGFDFRVSVGQLGQDRTSGQNALTFGPEFGNFTGGKYSYRSRAEVNRAYMLGQGDGSARNVQYSEDTARSGASPWAPREGAGEDTNLTADAALVDKADALVLAGRPFQLLSGELVSTDETQYQRDWNMGDLVNVSFAGQQYTALIRAVRVSVDGNGKEAVAGAFEIQA